MSKLPEVVKQISSLGITGNVIPNLWWRNITFDNGKPDSVGVVILSEIVYWYRATEVRDETTGHVIDIKKKFKADLLQRSTQSFADAFGFTKRQVTDALRRLSDNGLIRREFRNITTQGGVLSNVQFIEPVPEAIKNITFLVDERKAKSDETQEAVRYNARPVAVERGTYTETTTEITTETKNNDGAYVTSPDDPLFDVGQPKPTRFKIELDWRPDVNILKRYCNNAGCPIDNRPPALMCEIIGEWVNYWHAEGSIQSESKWYAKLSAWIKRKLADHDSQPTKRTRKSGEPGKTDYRSDTCGMELAN